MVGAVELPPADQHGAAVAGRPHPGDLLTAPTAARQLARGRRRIREVHNRLRARRAGEEPGIHRAGAERGRPAERRGERAGLRRRRARRSRRSVRNVQRPMQLLPHARAGRPGRQNDDRERGDGKNEPAHDPSVAVAVPSVQRPRRRSGRRPMRRCSSQPILDNVTDPEFETLSEAVLAISAERSVDAMLQRLVETARSLGHARYAALGIPDGDGGFAEFITSGMSEKAIEAIGPLPRQHGLLDAMLHAPVSERLPNIQADPRFGGWPSKHPNMKSFLGVSIVAKGEVIAAFYLANRKGASEFTADDQALIETLAAHAAIAIENARLYERSRELSIVEERNRLARELHDSVTQTLFSLSLTAESAATLADSNPVLAKEQILSVRHLATEALQEMRSLIFELRPAELEAEGLVATLRKRVDVLRRVYRREIGLDVRAERRLDAETETQLFRIVQEA